MAQVFGQAVSPENRVFFYLAARSDRNFDAGSKDDTSAFNVGHGLNNENVYQAGQGDNAILRK
jgi:hypothetical protein